MDEALLRRLRAYARNHHDQELELLRTLAGIPAPTRHEERRAAFVAEWLRRQGANEVWVDGQKNVLCLLRRPSGESDHATPSRPQTSPGTPSPYRDLVLFCAHTDVVFDDVEPFEVREEGGRLLAPGIGDDTANLVALLMATSYLLEHPQELAAATARADLLVVANSCEEGLGNLDGTKAVFRWLEACGTTVRAFVSLDLYLPQCIGVAVGSERWRIEVRTQGGHSYHDFGRPNAIARLCRVVGELYASTLPQDPTTGARTTINAGRIEGGSTVNAIASQASCLFEYRSESAANLAAMRARLQEVVASAGERGVRTSLERIGMRPGNAGTRPEAQERVTRLACEAIRSVTGEEPDLSPASTDANIPLSLGIPALTVGTVHGGLLHTRDEWVDPGSLEDGLVLALALMLELPGGAMSQDDLIHKLNCPQAPHNHLPRQRKVTSHRSLA